MNAPVDTTEFSQDSDEWVKARLGKVTASRISLMMAKTPSGKGWGASRANLMAALISERLTGAPSDGYMSDAMARGKEVEAEARTAYEFLHDVEVEQVGFVPHHNIAMAGASPDGLVGDDGLVEIKCPNTNTHIDTLLGEVVPMKYVQQIQWQLACTGRKWCDFVSYDNRLPPSMSMFVKRVFRDDAYIESLEVAAMVFLSETDRKLRELRARFEPETQPLPVGMMP